MIETALILQVLFWLSASLVFLRRQDATMFHPIAVYLAFHGLVFVIRPCLTIAYDYDMVWSYMRFWPTEDQLVTSLAMSSFALLVFQGFATKFGKVEAYKQTRRVELNAIERRAFLVTALLVTPVAIYSILQTLRGFEGEHVNGIYILKDTTGYVIDAQQMLVPLSFLFVLFFKRWWSYLPLIGFLLFRMYYGWARWTIVLTLLMLLLGAMWRNGQRWPRLKYLILIPFIWATFVGLGLDRGAVKRVLDGRRSVSGLLASSPGWATTFDSLDFANFDFLTFVHSVVPSQTNTYTYGLQYLQVFTEPIPRILWTSKPVGAPIQFFDLNDFGNFFGLTVSIVGDGWMSGGWVGLFITMATLGILLGKFHQWFWSNQNRLFVVFLYLIIHAEILQLFRDGGISIFKFILFTTMPIWIWNIAAKVLRRLHPVRRRNRDLPMRNTQGRTL